MLYKHCHERTNIENFTDFIKTKNNISEHTDDITKPKDVGAKDDKKTVPKRVSYRAKINEVGSNDSVKKRTDNNNLKKQKIKNINVLQENTNKKEEKKKGWWTQ